MYLRIKFTYRRLRLKQFNAYFPNSLLTAKLLEGKVYFIMAAVAIIVVALVIVLVVVTVADHSGPAV
jgi:hypothetical protein